MKTTPKIICLTAVLASASITSACSGPAPTGNNHADRASTPPENVPAQVFDLSRWSITVPLDGDGDNRADTIGAHALQHYQLAHFFYLDDNQHMVFASPNKAITSPNSTNTRSELRQEFLDAQGQQVISGDSRKGYFALASNPQPEAFAEIGGTLSATLRVDHVSLNAGYPQKPPAYSVVVGQIHAAKVDALQTDEAGLGWGNEPLKIFYKKFPGHATGSVFWAYERNLPKDDPHRTGIDYPVWGNGWENAADPGTQGIALGESFSYTVKVDGDVMHLAFSAKNHPTVKHQINLADNKDANGHPDEHDDPLGYKNDWLFFKAGAYNQCSTKDAPSFRYPACPGTGNWEEDEAAGNYTRVTFSHLSLHPGETISD